MQYRSAILFVSAILPRLVIAQNQLELRVIGATPTQAVITYIAPDPAPCGVQSSTDASFGIVDRDIDPNIFPGSDSDLRPGNPAQGRFRTVIIGFRGTARGSDGRLYSRALEAATTHYVKVSCRRGSYIGTLTLQTQNPPLGNTAPDYIPFDAEAFGNYAWPTIDFTAPTSQPEKNTYIDPLTGIRLVRWTGPGDGSGEDKPGIWFGAADLAASWTNAAGVLSTKGYAEYSGRGGPENSLFLWGPSGIYRPSFTGTEFFGLDDLQLGLTGYGDHATSNDRTLVACISADFGASCVDGKSIKIVLPKGKSAPRWEPSSYVSPILAGWGSPRVTNDMLTNTFFGSVLSVEGSAITWGGADSFGENVYFPVTVLKTGMRIAISGTAPSCPQNLCTIASVKDEQHLTIRENIASWNPLFTTTAADVAAGADAVAVTQSSGFVVDPWPGRTGLYSVLLGADNDRDTASCKALSNNRFSDCTGIAHSHPAGAPAGQNVYGFPNFGVKLWKQTGNGTIYLNSALARWAVSNNFFTEFQGVGSTGCNPNYVTVAYAADGKTRIPSTVGYTCTFVDDFFVGEGTGDIYLYLLIPSTGETRKLSNLNNGVVVNNADPVSGWSYNSRTGRIQSCRYNDNLSDAEHQHFAAWSDHRDNSIMNPAIKCTDLSMSGTVEQEIKTAYPQIDFQYFGHPVLASLSYPFAKFMMRPGQGALGWFCDYDVSEHATATRVLYCHNSWDTYPSRFAGVHGFEYFLGKTDKYQHGYSVEHSFAALALPNRAGIERWDIPVRQIINNAGSTALSKTFVDPDACEQLGVVDERWKKLGATGHNCIQMEIGDPVALHPAPEDLKSLGDYPPGSRPAPWPHNAASCGGDGTTANCWSYLQPIAPGDMLVDYKQSGPRELFVVAAVNPVTNQSTITRRIVLSRYFNPFGQCASRNSAAHGPEFVLSEVEPWVCYGAGFVLYPNGSVQNGKVDNTALTAGHIIQWRAGDKFVLSGPYSVTFAKDLGGYGTGYGVRVGQIPEVWGHSANWGVQSMFPFDSSFKGVGIEDVQTHAGGSTYACSDCEWIVDGRPLGGAGGGATALWKHTYTLMPGTNSVFRLGLPNKDTLDLKRRSIRLFAGQHLIYNVSSPSAQLSDKTPWQGCVAYHSGECYSGSKAGDIYEVVPRVTTSLGYCSIDMSINTPCAAQMGIEVAAYTQHDIAHPDPLGLRGRVLTMGFNGPARTNNYANMHALPNGDWGVTAVAWADGRRSDVFGVKLPPLPDDDSVVRNTFVPVPVSVGGQPGSSVRIRFGYREYGLDLDGEPLFCSPNRREQCTTAVANSDPYAFTSEPQSWAKCDDGCTITIPASSGRVLYYVVDRQSHAGAITRGGLEVAVVP